MAYLDYNATAPLRPGARAAMLGALELGGNASSVHGAGRAARRVVETARARVADLVGATPAQVIFTAGATEANATALRGFGRSVILVSAIEHDSVLAAVPEAIRLPVTPDGTLDLEALDRLLERTAGPALVAVMAVNNETGAIQPIAEVVRRAHARGALVHCDAVQAAGKLPIDLMAWGVDSLSLSAHKLGGPQGAGALVLREGLGLEPLLRGGGQERRRRAGTENIAAIAGFGAAAVACADDDLDGLQRMRDRLEAIIRDAAPEVPVHAAAAPRVPTVSCIGLPGLAAETQVMRFDLEGIAVSAGSACSSGKVAASHVLAAMGVEAGASGEAVRVSLGWATAAVDVDRFAQAWLRLYQDTRRRRAA